MGIDRDNTSEDELVALMLQESRLIRRPLIEIDGELLSTTSSSSVADYGTPCRVDMGNVG